MRRNGRWGARRVTGVGASSAPQVQWHIERVCYLWNTIQKWNAHKNNVLGLYRTLKNDIDMMSCGLLTGFLTVRAGDDVAM
jgi:hypothetical protein